MISASAIALTTISLETKYLAAAIILAGGLAGLRQN